MDILTVLRFVHDHNDKVIGALVALFLLTSILLLIRSLGEKAGRDVRPGSGAAVDVKDIEGAMRRVLSSQPISVATASPVSQPAPSTQPNQEATKTSVANEPTAQEPASDEESPEVGILTQLVADRDQQITDLLKELDEARAKLLDATTTAAPSSNAEIEKQLSDLQARLAEYEIIEDDIADLSLYKEENEKLRDELEKLKGQVGQEPSGGPSKSSFIQSGTESELKFEKADKFELDPDDDIVKQFSQATGSDPTEGGEDPSAAAESAEEPPAPGNPQAEIDMILAEAEAKAASPEAGGSPESSGPPESGASPLDTEVDTQKMLSEVESLGASEVEDESDALAEELDTDKLLQEVASLEAPPEPEEAARTESKVQATSESDVEDEPVDDLLAEFKDVAKG